MKTCKWNTLEDILKSLKEETPEITVSDEIIEKSSVSIRKMLAIS